MEPDQSARDYTLVLNKNKRKKGQMTDVLPLPDIHVQPVFNDPDGIILGGPEQPPPFAGTATASHRGDGQQASQGATASH